MIKKLISFFIFFYSICVFAQINESFEDISFLTNCFGTSEKFIISDASLVLQDATASGSSNQAFVSLPSESINEAEWCIKIKINNATSSANYVRYYVVADSSDLLSSDLNAYYIMIGNTQDEISLYKQIGNVRTKIIDGEDKRIDFSTIEVEVKLTRDEEGNWNLYSKLPTEEEFFKEGACYDISLLNSKYSGLFVQYSSGNKNNYYFKDWLVEGEKAKEPYVLQKADFVFSELMVKPSPKVELPAVEYIELYNRTDEKLYLSSCFLVDMGKKYPLTNVILLPKTYLLLCHKNYIDEFSFVENKAGLESFPTLTDAGKLLWIENEKGEIIDWLEYADWYKDEFKAAGGWSLEKIDTEHLSHTGENWQASLDKRGGTPGEENSVKDVILDFDLPQVIRLSILSDSSIHLFFNKEIREETLLDFQNYQIENLQLDSVKIVYPKAESVILFFHEKIQENFIYYLSVSHLQDKSGHILNADLKFALPKKADALDVVINEILFRPKKNSYDYVELYNRSDKIIDLADLKLSNRKEGVLQAGSFLTENSTLVFPKEYVLISAHVNQVCEDYFCDENAIKINLKSMPSYPNDKGSVVLLNKTAEIIDEFSYTEKMHHVLIKNTEGISLERVHPDFLSQDENTWHSASFESGGGTPGYQNSQFREKVDSETTFQLSSQIFSPNNDGVEDILEIRYHLPKEDFLCTIDVFNANGAKVKSLVNNVLLASQGQFSWDGSTDKALLAPVGLYLIYIQAHHSTGEVLQFKLPCVLSY